MSEQYEMAIEVGPIDPATVEALKAEGFSVYQGNRSWRVEAVADVLGPHSVRAQAEHLAAQIIERHGLTTLSPQPVVALRSTDRVETLRANYIVASELAAYDRPPLPRPKRRWWQRAMELGLGERKED